MAELNMKDLLEAGVHFGHQTRRWNPKMKNYIFGERNGIHIIDLQKTVIGFTHAAGFVRDLVANGGVIVFVGTKKQAKDAVKEEAVRAGVPYVTERWLGGTLTNFKTIKTRIDRLKELQTIETTPRFEHLTKREKLELNKEKANLERALSGIRDLNRLPDAIFVIDPHNEAIAVAEANSLGIKVVSVVDTNCDPDVIDYIVPGNDDAIRAVKLFAGKIADAVLEGRAASAGDQAARDGGEAAAVEAPAAADAVAAEAVAQVPVEALPLQARALEEYADFEAKDKVDEASTATKRKAPVKKSVAS